MKNLFGKKRMWTCGCLFAAVASATEFGTLIVQENNGYNYASSVGVYKGPGSTAGWRIVSANRGDITVYFDTANDTAEGLLVTCLCEDGRDNSMTGVRTGVRYATAGAEVSTTNWYVPIFEAPAGGTYEWNANVALGYFRFDEWLAAYVKNSANNGEMTSLVGSPGINLGVEFIDTPGTPAGVYQLDLTGLGACSEDGILLMVGTKDEDNFAMSKANDDGTFTLYCHNNGSDGAGCENDPVGFVYIPVTDVGTKNLVACGRVRNNSISVGGGSFMVSKGTTGIWYLSIPGHSQYTGTLLISPEGGSGNNIDNIIAWVWEETGNRWKITSRDLTGMGLQNAGTGNEEMFSFAFFSTEKMPPAVSVTTPADLAMIPAGDTVMVKADVKVFGGRTIQSVEFFANDVPFGINTQAPFAIPYEGGLTGAVVFTAVAVDSQSAVSTSLPVRVCCTPGVTQNEELAAVLLSGPAWTVRSPSQISRRFIDSGTTAGRAILNIGGFYPSFSNGVFLASNWNTSLWDKAASDNIAGVAMTANGRVETYIVTHTTHNNAASANPGVALETAGVAIAYLPFSDNWIGGRVTAAGTVDIGNISGVTVYRPATGLYGIRGLPKEGNLMAQVAGNSGTDPDNVLSVFRNGLDWFVDVLDNGITNVGRQNGQFLFVYVPTNAVGVYSGRVRGGTNAVPETLNSALNTLGFTVEVNSDPDGYYTLTFGNGLRVNPKTASLFITADSTVRSESRDNLWSWCADGNSFRVFAQKLPFVDDVFVAEDFTFLVVPFSTAKPGTVLMFR